MTSESERFLGLGNGNDNHSSLPPPEVPIRKRLILFGVAWLVAFLVSLPNPLAIVFALPWLPLFPYGFGVLLDPKLGQVVLILGWVLYIVLTVVIFGSGTKRWFYLFYAILVALLLVNAGGCHYFWRQVSSIDG